MKSKIILGIDPGTLVMGYGLIEIHSANVTLLEMGVLQLARKQDHAERLDMIFRKMEALIKIHHPMAVAIEAPFFGKNVQSMLKLGRAQGVAIAAAMMHGLSAVEYAPRKIKQSITGRGNATKAQVDEMLRRILKFDQHEKFMDATDAVAVALCHHYALANTLLNTTTIPKNKKSKNTWSSYIDANPQKIKNG